mgnify:CR=1 FL=1
MAIYESVDHASDIYCSDILVISFCWRPIKYTFLLC